jgi:hypothetical protein
MRACCRRPGVLPGTCPGLRLFSVWETGYREHAPCGPSAVYESVTPGLQPRWLSAFESIRRYRQTRPDQTQEPRCACEKRGEQFWGRLALILNLRRVLNPVYTKISPLTTWAIGHCSCGMKRPSGRNNLYEPQNRSSVSPRAGSRPHNSAATRLNS